MKMHRKPRRKPEHDLNKLVQAVMDGAVEVFAQLGQSDDKKPDIGDLARNGKLEELRAAIRAGDKLASALKLSIRRARRALEKKGAKG